MLSGAFYGGLVAFLAVTTHAIGDITVAGNVTAGASTSITYSNASSGTYRVYLAATVPGFSEGLSCFLINSTTLPSSGLNVSIPADVGPSAGNYYSIAIEPVCSDPIYSPKFNFIGGSGVISSYETHLGGAPLWLASQLPCTAYNCARQCAQANYPGDLTDDYAYATMTACIRACPGVTGDGPYPCAPLANNATAATPTTPSTSCAPGNTTAPGATNSSATGATTSAYFSPAPHAGARHFRKNFAPGAVAAVVATATTLGSEI